LFTAYCFHIKMKKVIQYLISLIIAGGLLWYVFKDINLSAMFAQLAKADLKWIIISGLIGLVAHIARALRWKILLQPLNYRPSTFNTTLAVLIGYFANFIFPRMGEVSRCGSLQKTDDVPFQKSFGTVVTERIFDVVCLLIILSLNLILEYDKLKDFIMTQFGDKLTIISIVLVVGILGGIAGIYLFKKYQERLSVNPILGKIIGFINGLLEGVLSIRQMANPWGFVFYSFLIWVMYYFSGYVLFFAIPETQNLGMLAGLTVLTVGSFAIATPTQGGIGPYHYLVGNAMVIYGLAQEKGIMLATFIHGSQMISLLILGGISFLITLFIKKKNSV
jgi:glycosyltransferase 2 family protein